MLASLYLVWGYVRHRLWDCWGQAFDITPIGRTWISTARVSCNILRLHRYDFQYLSLQMVPGQFNCMSTLLVTHSTQVDTRLTFTLPCSPASILAYVRIPRLLSKHLPNAFLRHILALHFSYVCYIREESTS